MVHPVANPEEWRMCLMTLFSLALLENLTRPLQQQTTQGEREMVSSQAGDTPVVS